MHLHDQKTTFQTAVRSRHGRMLSVITPCYNEEESIDVFLQRLKPILDSLRIEYEVIFINDGSIDRTLSILIEQCATDIRVKTINLSRNFGKDIAMTAGLDAAVGDMVIPIDVDLQDPPELIPDFVLAWEAGADMVIGVRIRRNSDSFIKRLSANTFYWLFNAVAEVPVVANAGDFRLLSRPVVDVLKQLPERRRFMKGLFNWVGFKQVLIPYDRPLRAAGSSSWKYWKLWNFALDGITSFSTMPLRIWTYIGLMLAVVSSVYALYVVSRTLFYGIDVPGYASLLVIMLIGFSAIMIALGILGEYVSRIYDEVKSRPIYIVKDRFGF